VPALVLDTEAVNALAHPTARGATSLRAAAIGRLAQRHSARPIIPLPVLAEVYRGDRTDVAVDRLIDTAADVVGITVRTVRLAGSLRAHAGRGSAVDALVVAAAIRLGGAVIATADPDDLRALAADHSNVKIWPL
jgi:predicted nucleic acid-binding protein